MDKRIEQLEDLLLTTKGFMPASSIIEKEIMRLKLEKFRSRH